MKIRIPALLIAAILPFSFTACKPAPIQPPPSSSAPVSSEIPGPSAPEEEQELLFRALKEGDSEQIQTLLSLDGLPEALQNLFEEMDSDLDSLPEETREKFSAVWKEMTASLEYTLVSWDSVQEDQAAAQLLLKNRDFSKVPTRLLGALLQTESVDSLLDNILQELQKEPVNLAEFPIQLTWTKQEGRWKAQAGLDLLGALSGGMLDQIPLELFL